MKIAHVLLGRCNPESANGIDRTVYHLSKTQAALGHRVGIFSITEKTPIEVPGAEVFAFHPRYPPFPAPTARLADLLHHRSPFNLPPALTSSLLRWAAGIVHFHFVHAPQFIRLAALVRKRDIPYCVSLHGGLAAEAQRRHRAGKKLFGALFERSYLNHAAFIHGVSEADLEGARAYGVENRTVIAPNCIDPGLLPPSTDPTLLSSRYPQLAGRRVFLFLGRLDPEQKGLDLLLEAWGREALPGALVLVGPEWRRSGDRLRALAGRHDLDERVVFAGPRSGSEKWSVLAGSDVFVHPSRWEAGVPFSVLEAMLASRPVLLTPAADPGRLVERYQAGAVVPADVEGISSGIRRLHDLLPDDLQRFGRNGHRLVLTEFRWEKTATTLLEEYERSARTSRHAQRD